MVLDNCRGTREREIKCSAVTFWHQQSITKRLIWFNEILHQYFTRSLSSLAACVIGTLDPLNAVLFTGFIEIYETAPDPLNSNSTEQADKIWEEALPYVYAYIGICSCACIGQFIKTICAFHSGTRLIERIREMFFEATVFQDISYFDDPNNTPGVICSRMSSDCARIGGVTGIQMATWWLCWMLRKWRKMTEHG